jgi:small subunit ribosomal protein S4
MTDYGEQLREKQKARRIYGVAERQFRGYYSQAIRARGVTGERLLQILETRLDNVVYRLGLADSRPQARQLVRHGHIIVNGRRVNIPSYLVRANDTITLREQSKKSPLVKELIEKAASRAVPAWLTFDKGTLVGQVVRLPRREEIDIPVRETAIIERYSR